MWRAKLLDISIYITAMQGLFSSQDRLGGYVVVFSTLNIWPNSDYLRHVSYTPNCIGKLSVGEIVHEFVQCPLGERLFTVCTWKWGRRMTLKKWSYSYLWWESYFTKYMYWRVQPTWKYQLRVKRGPHGFCLGLKLVELV